MKQFCDKFVIKRLLWFYTTQKCSKNNLIEKTISSETTVEMHKMLFVVESWNCTQENEDIDLLGV